MSACWSGALCPGQSSDNGRIHQEAAGAPDSGCSVRVTILFLSSLSRVSPALGPVWIAVGWSWPAVRCPSSHSLAPLLNRSVGGNQIRKSSWGKIKTGVSLTSYCYRHSRLNMGTINWESVSLYWIVRKKKDKPVPSPPHFSEAQLHSQLLCLFLHNVV